MTALPIDVNGKVIQTPFYLEVAQGNVPGYSSVNKFGSNDAVATTGEDIWSAGGTYGFYPTVAQSMELVSTSAEDGVAGTGAITVKVYGLDANWDEISEIVTTNGITEVPLVNKYIRMSRAYAVTAGSTETNVGAISIQIASGGTVAAHIKVGTGQTLQCIYTIPRGRSGYFLKGYVALSNADKNGQDGTFQWLMRANNGTTGAWAINGEVTLVNIGSSYWVYEYGVPAGPIPEKTDIRIRMTTATATMSTQGGFDLILIDN